MGNLKATIFAFDFIYIYVIMGVVYSKSITSKLFGGIMDVLDILSLLSGVAFFLFGMSTMGNGLKQLAGNKMETYLWKLSSTPVKGFLLGTLVAAVIQSSGATSVMVVSFVNAGMMKFSQAVSIILGANVGTTMTGWILTLSSAGGSGAMGKIFSTTMLIAVMVLFGIVFYMFTKKTTTKSVGMILLGLGTLLEAMTLISAAVSPLKDSPTFKEFLVKFSNPVLCIIAGIIVSAVLQSSSASVGILQAICVTGALPYSICLPIILGINIGAASPVLLSMIGGTKNSKRAALSFLFMNILGLFVIYILYIPISLIFNLSTIMSTPSSVIGLAILNSGIKVVVALILLPLHKIIEKSVLLFVKETDDETADIKELDGLKESLLSYPEAALSKAEATTFKMADLTLSSMIKALDLLNEFNDASFQKVVEKESLVDKYEDKLGNYIVKVSKNPLTKEEQATVSQLLSVINDMERISDHSLNIAQTALEIKEKKIVFSEEGQLGINMLVDATKEILTMTINSFLQKSPDLADDVEPLEETIDDLTKILRAQHIERLQNNDCTILMGFVFNDIMTNLERVSDHCSNIAFSVCQNQKLDKEAHEYAEILITSDEFKTKYEDYRKKYIDPVI